MSAAIYVGTKSNTVFVNGDEFGVVSTPFQGGVGLPALLCRAKRAGVVADDCDAIEEVKSNGPDRGSRIRDSLSGQPPQTQKGLAPPWKGGDDNKTAPN